MKNTTINKFLALIVTFFCAMAFGYGQTILTSGDIAITGFNADDPDEFTFVLLTDIDATTEIKFTDNGLQTINYNITDEGILAWTADSDLICGTEIIIENTGAGFSASSGTVLEPGLGFLLSANGDQIIAYQGLDAAPTYIYAINFDGAGWFDSDSTNTTTLPTGLTNGTNAIDLGEIDNAKYNCSVTSDQALILAAVSNNTNWTLSNTILSIGGCTYTCTITCVGTTTWSNLGWSAGAPNSTTNAVIDFDYDTNTNGNINACSLLVNVGAKLTISDEDNTGPNNTYVQVINGVTVDGEIVMNPKASFIQNNNNGLVDGNVLTIPNKVKVEKLTAPLNAWYEYTYWSSPVLGETIGDALSDADTNRRFWFDGSKFLDLTAETGNNNAAVVGQDDIDDDNNDWQYATGATIMTPGIGYAATHSEAAYLVPPGPNPPVPQFKYTFEGPFNNGVITVPIYRNDTAPTNDNNWNFIGNPYPSAISADLFLAGNTDLDTDVNNIGGAIFLWSQNTAPSGIANGNQNLNFAASDYAIINATGQTAGGDGIIPNRYIPSGQGFFVSLSDAATTVDAPGNPDVNVRTTDVIFNNSMRVKGTTDNSQFFRMAGKQSKKTSTANKLWVNLTSDNGVFNQTLIGYVAGATNNDDGLAYDATKNLSAGASAILYSNIANSNNKFAIQGKAKNSLNEDEVISLGFKTSIDVATIYTLSIAQLEGDFLNSNAIYVKDNLLNTSHDLKTGDYNFTSVIGEFNERFEIVFNSEALSTDEHLTKGNALSIIEKQNGDVQFKLSGNLEMQSVQIIDLQGRVLYNLNASGKSKTHSLSNLSQAPYIAKVTLTDGYVITKKALKRY